MSLQTDLDSAPGKRPLYWRKRPLYWGLALGLLVVLVGAALWMRTHSQSAGADSSGAGKAKLNKRSAGKEPANRVRMEMAAQRNIGLSVRAAETRNVIETLQVTGSVGANETKLSHIRPITQGRILTVSVRLGDHVRAGQILAVYDNIELGEILGQYGVALADLEKSRAAADASRKALERARNLVSLGAIAQAEVERRSADYATTTAAINIQRAELARIEEKMHRFGLTDAEIRKTVDASGGREHREVSRTILRAPFNGVVTKYDIAEGEVVGPDREVFTIADLSTVWVQADVYEKDIAALRKNVPVKVIVDSYPGESFSGRITYISDVLDPKTRTAKVRCEVLNPTGRLKLDMFATIVIPSPKGRSAVMVPSAALQQIDDQQIVFVQVAEDEFERRDVKLGSREGDWVEIVSGVKAGERVVTAGSFDLKSALLRAEIGEGE